MRHRLLLACLGAFALLLGAAPAHAGSTELVSIDLVFTPAPDGSASAAYSVRDVPLGAGPELVGACWGECQDYSHPMVDIDVASRTITVMIPGNANEMTNIELTVVMDGLTRIVPLDGRGLDPRDITITPDGVRMSWVALTAGNPATTVIRYESDVPQAPADQPGPRALTAGPVLDVAVRAASAPASSAAWVPASPDAADARPAAAVPGAPAFTG